MTSAGVLGATLGAGAATDLLADKPVSTFAGLVTATTAVTTAATAAVTYCQHRDGCAFL